MITSSRKERSDKKKDVKPIVPFQIYENISRLSYVSDRPMKDIGVLFCKKALYSSQVMSQLSKFIVRDYWTCGNHLIVGHNNGERFKFADPNNKKRLQMRFSKSDHEQLKRLSFSMDCSVSATAACLLYFSLNNIEIINAFCSYTLKSKLDIQRVRELKEIYRYVNQNSPYQEEMPFAAFIMSVLQEIKECSITRILTEWINKHTR